MIKYAVRRRLWIVCLFGCAIAASAQTKIAVVDLRKLFDNYYLKDQLDAQLKAKGAEFEKQRQPMLDQYEKANEEYRKLLEMANNQAVSAAERNKQKQLAESKLREIQNLEQELIAFDRRARSTLAEERNTLHDRVIREIREVITARAKAGGYHLVLDTAAEATSFAPVILQVGRQNDLTDEILQQINAKAPRDVLDRDRIR